MHPTRSSVSVLLFAAMAAAQPMIAPQQPAPQAPTTLTEAWQFALSMLRAHKVPVLVFVLPPADAKADPAVAAATVARLQPRFQAHKMMGNAPKLRAGTARELFLLQLQGLRGSPDEQLRRLLLLDLAVVAEAATCGARPGETVVLLAADGTRAAGFALDLADEAAVVRSLAPRLLDETQLAARRANLAPSLQRDLAEFERLERAAQRSDADTQRLMALRERLALHLPVIAPVLLAESQPLPSPGRGISGIDWLAGAELPLGTAIDQMVDPCTGCGMGFVPPRLVSTLKLLAQ